MNKYMDFLQQLLATHHAGAQDLLDSSSQVTGLGPTPHDASNVDNFVESNVAIVFNWNMKGY